MSAPPSVELATLTKVLLAKDVEPIWISKIEPSAATRAQRLSRAVQAADFVIAVLDPEQPNSNVYSEVGYANALGKQVLLIAPAALDSIPGDLQSVLRARLEIRD